MSMLYVCIGFIAYFRRRCQKPLNDTGLSKAWCASIIVNIFIARENFAYDKN